MQKKKIVLSALLAILLIHAALLGYSGFVHSPTWDEWGHLPAGIVHWMQSRFDPYRVNPPLVRMIAASPVLFAGIDSEVSYPGAVGEFRSERWVAYAIADKNKMFDDFINVFFLFTLARWACIPFSLIGAIVCFLWARELYGDIAGLLSASLWCFSPMVIGFGSLITPDVASAALGITAFYVFFHWLKSPSWSRCLWCGFLLGLAELTKYTLILFYVIFPLIWLFWWFFQKQNEKAKHVREQCFQMLVFMVLSIVVINVGYEFQGTLKQLEDYQFISKALAGSDQIKNSFGNKFRGSFLGEIPIPFPEQYILGIDVQKLDFERNMPSYLQGEWKDGGWYHYYVFGLLIKEPLAVFGFALIAGILPIVSKKQRVIWREEVILLAPFLIIIIFVSSQNGFNHHLRYIFPAFPFVYILLGKSINCIPLKKKLFVPVFCCLSCWFIGSSLYYYPHSMSYFNELVGGPKNGHYHLGNSNIDWGQDLLYLKRWLDKHPDIVLYGPAYDMPELDTTLIGINAPLPPSKLKISPGWHAISVNQIHNRSGDYEYFLKFKPYDMIGYSTYIYHITLEEANRVRLEMGLPDWEPPQIYESKNEVRP